MVGRRAHAEAIRDALGLAAAAMVLSMPARAEEPSTPTALAETPFQTAKKLMADGDFVHACPKLAESQRLDPGGGTVLTLALCHEGEGKTATAWAEFNEARALAVRDGQKDREIVAREHTAALEPKLF